MYILVIETSTSAVKSAIYDTDAEMIIKILSSEYSRDMADMFTIDAERMFELVCSTVKEIVNKIEYRINAVVLCSIWHSLLLLDGNLKPTGRIKTWMENGAAGYLENNVAQDMRKDLYKRTGCIAHPCYPLWKYIASGDNDFRYISSQGEYIFLKMTGKLYASNVTASGTGWFNINSLNYDEEIIRFAGIDAEQLPELCEPDFSLPMTEEAACLMSLEPGIPVVIGGADGALNQIGCGACDGNIMTMSVGTSGAVRIASNSVVLSEKMASWCYYSGEKTRLAGAAVNGACNCVNSFSELTGKSFDELRQEAYGIKVENAPIYLPFIYGERSPGWSGKSFGGFYFCCSETTDGEKYYAMLEGILFSLKQCIDLMPINPSLIRLSGGIVNDPLWLCMAGKIFEYPIYINDFKDASVLGAASIAMKSLKINNSIKDFRWINEKRLPQDASDLDMYNERYRRYLELYDLQKQ